MGPIEAGIIEQAMRQGIDVPEKIKNRPEVAFGLEFYFASFMNLSCDRAYGMDIGPIPTMSILNYATYYDVEGEDASRFLEIIRLLDGEFLKHHNAKQKRDVDRAKRAAKRKK